MPQIIKRTEQCKVEMQIAWLKLKLFDEDAVMLTSKRNGELNCHKTFDSFSSYISAYSFKLMQGVKCITAYQYYSSVIRNDECKDQESIQLSTSPDQDTK